MDTRELFDALCVEFGTGPLRNGEAPINCPWCGKESDNAHVHCSFSERGVHCFVCGNSDSLAGFARKMGSRYAAGAPDRYAPPIIYAPKPKPRRRYDILDHNPDELARRFREQPAFMAPWQKYAPMLTMGMIDAYLLGMGRLPEYSSRCQHLRLQVPLIAGGHAVGFRARALECDCGKWLGPGGNPSKFLYNGQRLTEPSSRCVTRAGDRESRVYVGDTFPDAHLLQNSVLFIVENPVDAILLEQAGLPAVATLGVTNWEDNWTALLCRAQPWLHRIIVMYDNDVPGNGGTPQAQAQWRKEHRGLAPPANGPKLVNRLREAGLPAFLFPWGPEYALKADVGDFLRTQPPEMSAPVWESY